jgi:hypothetical protein
MRNRYADRCTALIRARSGPQEVHAPEKQLAQATGVELGPMRDQ